MPTLPAVWLALFTAVGTDAGTGFTEVSGNGYARAQVAGTLVTSATTLTSSATLTFASVPAWVVAGMTPLDVTTPSAITAAQTLLSTTGTTAVMSANANATVGSGDTITFSAFPGATGTGPSSFTNGSIVTFPAATGAGWGTVIAFGLYDASSSGNLIAWDYLGNFSWLPATVSSASPGVITAKAHGFSASDPLIFSTEYGGTAPTFSQSNFTGVLLAVGPTTDTFTVTNAATAVNTSSTGSGMVRKIVQQSIPAGVTASFAASTLTITSA